VLKAEMTDQPIRCDSQRAADCADSVVRHNCNVGIENLMGGFGSSLAHDTGLERENCLHDSLFFRTKGSRILRDQRPKDPSQSLSIPVSQRIAAIPMQKAIARASFICSADGNRPIDLQNSFRFRY
jgi:hypothetical protein